MKTRIVILYTGLMTSPTGPRTKIKGTVSREFLLLAFPLISFPQAPDYKIRAVSNF